MFRREQFSERGNALALFPLFCSREGRRQKAEGAERVFSSFFVRFFFENSALSLLSLSFLSLFSLFSLKLVRVFARILSTRKLFGGGSKLQSSSSSFLIIKVNNNTQSAFYVVNAQKNKNRTRFKAESERELLFDRL